MMDCSIKTVSKTADSTNATYFLHTYRFHCCGCHYYAITKKALIVYLFNIKMC